MKWNFTKLRKYDEEHGTSIVREIEMIVDYYVEDSGIIIQFWKDTQVYHVGEAVSLLSQWFNGRPHAYQQLKEKVNAVLARIS